MTNKNDGFNNSIDRRIANLKPFQKLEIDKRVGKVETWKSRMRKMDLTDELIRRLIEDIAALNITVPAAHKKLAEIIETRYIKRVD